MPSAATPSPVGTPGAGPALLVRAGPRVCAIALEHVVETMRPLAVAPLAAAPPFVDGAAVVRGLPLPVVHLDRFLGGAGAPPARFVHVRAGGRDAVLGVDAVIGVAPAAPRDGARADRLLGAAPGEAVEALAALDGELLVVLEAARLVPGDAPAPEAA
jgi:purine-binding chemotaxis protein CheW